MLNTHIVALPFYFHVEILETNIIFDRIVVVSEDKLNHLKPLSS